MEWLQLSPNDTWSFAFMVWFFGAVAGYCLGRAHAAYITMSNFIKAYK